MNEQDVGELPIPTPIMLPWSL